MAHVAIGIHIFFFMLFFLLVMNRLMLGSSLSQINPLVKKN